MTENAPFFRPVLLKRVKSCGSCQSVIAATSQVAGNSAAVSRILALNRVGYGGLAWRILTGAVRHGVQQLWLGRCLDVKGAERPFSGRPARPKVGEANRLIRSWLFLQIPQPRNPWHAEFKGLTSHTSARIGSPFRTWSGDRDRGEVNPLIRHWLLAKRGRRSGGDSLNVKDLLTVHRTGGGRPFRVLRGDRNSAWPIY
jgi:hypothetical protein